MTNPIEAAFDEWYQLSEHVEASSYPQLQLAFIAGAEYGATELVKLVKEGKK